MDVFLHELDTNNLVRLLPKREEGNGWCLESRNKAFGINYECFKER